MENKLEEIQNFRVHLKSTKFGYIDVPALSSRDATRIGLDGVGEVEWNEPEYDEVTVVKINTVDEEGNEQEFLQLVQRGCSDFRVNVSSSVLERNRWELTES